MVLSKRGISKLLKESGPGTYTPESVNRIRELVEGLIKSIGKTSRELANNAGKKRVTENEIKLAAQFLIK